MSKNMKKVIAGLILSDSILAVILLSNIGGKRMEEAWKVNGQLIAGSEIIVERSGAEQNGMRKIALTFDDDVIIGLSQEISY